MEEEQTNTNPEGKPVDKFQKFALNPIFLICMSFLAIGIFAGIFFLTSRSWGWIEGWIYIGFFFVYITSELLILRKKNPMIIINRMKLKKHGLTEAEGADKWLMPIISISFTAVFLIPGFNEWYGWTNPPIFVEIIGFILLLGGFYFLFRSMYDNPYAAKVLDIREDSGHKLIDTGSYGIVRHPMYTGFSLMSLATPLALGSWWAMIPAGIMILTLIVRIGYEEAMLIEGLKGYEEYKKKVRFKLIPGIF
jgi:protein-S-isoprenylcysteine O-methyltransferase Ste14